MKKIYLITLAIVVLVIAGFADWYVFSTTPKRQPGEFPGNGGNVLLVAEQWVVKNAPTYVFDGSDIELTESRDGECEGCTDVIFSFASSHGGYGDRADLLVTQVITPHTMTVTVKDGEIIRAITDGKYNEITGAFSE